MSRKTSTRRVRSWPAVLEPTTPLTLLPNLGVVTGKAVMTYTEAEKTQARSNIYAAPFDALAYSGMQINGGMEVSQITTLGGSSTGGHIIDGWQ